MDRRLLASNGRVADKALEGQIEAQEFVTPVRHQLIRNAWLTRDPNGVVDRECLFGDAFSVIEQRDGLAFGRAEKNGYVGWLSEDALGEPVGSTHWVSVRTTWAYRTPDFKTEPALPLHMTSHVAVASVQDGWAELPGVDLFVPSRHLQPLDYRLDQVEAARAFLGTPYVWAGNSGFGIDCSGLVEVSAHAAGYVCAPDSDLQEAMPGEALKEEEALKAGDLLFWKGHVALATGEGTLIHANAHHMAVVEEPVSEVVERIGTSDTGPLTLRLRPERRPLPR